MSNLGNFHTCETNQGLMDIYIVAPKMKEKVPVVIVLQEAFGVNQHIRSVCDRLSQEGFIAAAPELYHRDGKRINIPYADRKEMMPFLGRLTNNQIIEDIRTTINFLDDLSYADTQKVHTLGFCVGGFASVLSATKLSIRKMVSFYGGGIVHPRKGLSLTPIHGEMSGIKSKCLFFFGGQDVSISHEDISEIEKKLTSSKKAFEVVIFEKSDHGFFCNDRKVYDEEAASIAWKKTLAFLK